jgi:hypothetical protein
LPSQAPPATELSRAFPGAVDSAWLLRVSVVTLGWAFAHNAFTSVNVNVSALKMELGSERGGGTEEAEAVKGKGKEADSVDGGPLAKHDIKPNVARRTSFKCGSHHISITGGYGASKHPRAR